MMGNVLDELMKKTGVLKAVYGEYSDKVVYDQEQEDAKRKLDLVFGYKDIWAFLPPKLDEQKTMDHMRTLMSIDIFQNPENTSAEANKQKFL